MLPGVYLEFSECTNGIYKARAWRVVFKCEIRIWIQTRVGSSWVTAFYRNVLYCTVCLYSYILLIVGWLQYAVNRTGRLPKICKINGMNELSTLISVYTCMCECRLESTGSERNQWLYAYMEGILHTILHTNWLQSVTREHVEIYSILLFTSVLGMRIPNPQVSARNKDFLSALKMMWYYICLDIWKRQAVRQWFLKYRVTL